MLDILPCSDSEALAAAREKELHLSRDKAIYESRITVAAVENGFYKNATGQPVDWSRAVVDACVAKRSIPPWLDLPAAGGPQFDRTRVQVANETTFAAARRLRENGHTPISLNFANGFKPGGGFLRGATAQEESLCRLSALYWTLVVDPMYLHHAYRDTAESTDWAILSPGVPFFRDDSMQPLDQPLRLHILTCAAPVAYSVGKAEATELLKRRIRRVLAIAQAHGFSSVVLGAWGCGAFGNEPVATARDFREAIETDFAGVFSDVIFAIADWSPQRKFLGPYRDVFA